MTASADRPAARGARSTEIRGARPHRRPAGLRRAPLTFRLAMGLFFIGGSALLVMLVLFASGVRDFPFWSWLLVAAAPVGLLIGAFRVRSAGLSLDG